MESIWYVTLWYCLSGIPRAWCVSRNHETSIAEANKEKEIYERGWYKPKLVNCLTLSVRNVQDPSHALMAAMDKVSELQK